MLRVTGLSIRLGYHSHQKVDEKSAQCEEHDSQQHPRHIASPVQGHCNHAQVRRNVFCAVPLAEFRVVAVSQQQPQRSVPSWSRIYRFSGLASKIRSRESSAECVSNVDSSSKQVRVVSWRA